MRNFFASILDAVEIIVIALGSVFLIRTFIAQPFLVSGSSMKPNFFQGDYLLVDELSYRFRPPERGEVIVFHYPNDESTYFIKRVIGLPGERVLIENGKVTIINKSHPDGFVLEEKYLPRGTITSSHSNKKKEFSLGDNQYLVLGDNRSYSFDSRDWGLLSGKEIVGFVRMRLWPLSALTVFAAPNY